MMNLAIVKNANTNVFQNINKSILVTAHLDWTNKKNSHIGCWLYLHVVRFRISETIYYLKFVILIHWIVIVFWPQRNFIGNQKYYQIDI